MQKQSAFVLLDVLLALTIMVILSTLAFTGFQYFLRHSEEKVLRTQLLYAIQRGRTEASVRHARVILCPANDATHCSSQWTQGQLLFVDAAGDGLLHDTRQIIAFFPSHLRHGTLLWRPFQVQHAYLVFAAEPEAAAVNGTFCFYPKTASATWAIRVNRLGRPRVILEPQGESCNTLALGKA